VADFKSDASESDIRGPTSLVAKCQKELAAEVNTGCENTGLQTPLINFGGPVDTESNGQAQ